MTKNILMIWIHAHFDYNKCRQHVGIDAPEPSARSCIVVHVAGTILLELSSAMAQGYCITDVKWYVANA